MSTIVIAIALISRVISDCVPATPSSFAFTSEDKTLKLNGREFNLKGAGWYGAETNIYIPAGLWAVPYSSLLDFLVNNSFNAIRLPFCVDMVTNEPMPAGGIDYNLNPEMKNMTSLQIYDFIIEQAGNRGLLVMLDMHRLNCNQQNPVWYDQQHPPSLVNATWLKLISRYTKQWNVFAIDIFNEPEGATWGDGSNIDWTIWCNQMGNTIHNTGAEYLIFCEGIASNGCNPGCFWAEDLTHVGNDPIKLAQQNKLVYSPHVYGPDIFNQTYFQTNDFPANMPAIWDQHFGYIANLTEANGYPGNAVVTGEWGGYYTDDDSVWMDAFIDYMISIDFRNNFIWCLNAGPEQDNQYAFGLLQMDWKTPSVPHLNKCQELQSSPTQFTYYQSNNSVCYS